MRAWGDLAAAGRRMWRLLCSGCGRSSLAGGFTLTGTKRSLGSADRGGLNGGCAKYSGRSARLKRPSLSQRPLPCSPNWQSRPSVALRRSPNRPDSQASAERDPHPRSRRSRPPGLGHQPTFPTRQLKWVRVSAKGRFPAKNLELSLARAGQERTTTTGNCGTGRYAHSSR